MIRWPHRTPSLTDERTLSWASHRVIGFLGPISTCFTQAWLASHRDRQRAFLVGGKRLSIMFLWDTEGGAEVDRSERDVAAIGQLVYGDPKEVR